MLVVADGGDCDHGDPVTCEVLRENAVVERFASPPCAVEHERERPGRWTCVLVGRRRHLKECVDIDVDPRTLG